MGHIIFRGVSTKDIGVLTAKMLPHKKPPVRHTEFVVQGRNGTMHSDEGYDAFNLPCTLTMFRANAYTRDLINAWADGTGKLITSDMPTRCWDASVLSEVTYTRREYGGLFYDTAQVIFRCQPIMHEAVPSVNVYTKSGKIANLGNVKAYPRIVVTGSGTCVFSVAGQQVTLRDVSEPVTLDCGAGYVYTASGAVSMAGEFPVLPLGESDIVITSGVTQLEITPNWGWL